MARHQVLQHRLVSCTSAIPHPFCQRHPKIQLCASLGITRPDAAASPRPPLPRRLGSSRARRCRAAMPADAPCRCTTHPQSQQLNPPPKHPYPSTSSSTLSPSIGTTLPQQNNSNSSVDKAVTPHPHAAGQLHSSICSSVTLHRHDTFLLDLHADGLFHPHSLLCFPSHKQEQS